MASGLGWYTDMTSKPKPAGGGVNMNPNSGNYLGSAPAQPKPQNNKNSSVLGAGDSGKVNGGWYGGQQYWAPGQGPSSGGDGGGGGGESQPNYDAELEAMYSSAMNATNEAEKYANEGYGADSKNIQSEFDLNLGRYGQEEKDLLGQTDVEEQKFNKVLQSAYAEAVRAYNALQQQGVARFGRGNSAGQAVGELAQQEYFRQQGKVNEKQVEGAQEFSTERLKIGQYVKQKIDDLTLYKQKALTDLKKNLNDQLMAIQARRGDIEANKTRDRLALLNDAVSRTRAIQDQDRTFRQQLALSAVSQMQEVSGRAFTPAEITAYMSEFTGAMSGANVGAGAQGSASTALKRNTGNNDEFSSLNLLQGGGQIR